MVIIILCIIFSLILAVVSFKKGVTAYNLFYLGMIVFLPVGWISSYVLADEMYLLNGDTSILNKLIVPICVFILISSIFLFLQKKSTRTNLKTLGKITAINKYVYVLYGLSAVFCVLLLLFINIKEAPLLNIGKYSVEEMGYYRDKLFQGTVVELLDVPRYIVFYMLIPICFFLKGMTYKIPNIIMGLFLFVALLTLSKTMFILNVFFYFIGKFYYTGKKISLIQLGIVSAAGFYLIVYSTYYMDVKRDLFEVLKIFYIRMIPTPIALSSIYSEIFHFEQGLRSSQYYTYIFGGTFSSIPVMAMSYISPISDGNAPTGILGMAFPNIPLYFHWLYYSFFILFILVVSNLINYIENYYFKSIFTIMFGILSWFLFLTEPLVALNSYGLMYIAAAVLLYLLVKRKITW